MKKLSILLALAVCVTAVMAQRETGIAGTVVDAQTLEPIVGARVRAGSGGCGGGCGGMAYTNDEGEYFISLRKAGAYIVSASAIGYESAVYPETVHVVQGQVVEEIDFALEPDGGGELGGITGKVTDEATGKVIRGAIVKAEKEGFSREVTQSCCRYRIPLPEGRYWVSATARGYEPGAYGDSVDVVAGRMTPDIDFTLGGGEPPEYGGIAGTVTDAETGEPLLGVSVKAIGRAGRGHDNTDEDGGYLIDRLPPGSYVVNAMMRGYEPARPETVEVVASQVTEDVDFALVPRSGEPRERGFIAGKVTDAETGEPVFPAQIMARGHNGQGGARTNEEGEYLLALRPGEYILRAAARQYLPANYPEMLEVAAGETLFGIDFELEHVLQLRAAIGGWVFDSYTQAELEGAKVTAIGPDGSYETTSDEFGEYLFPDVEPGDYRITVSRTGYESMVYRRLVTLEPDQADGYSTPALYSLAGIVETPGPRAVQQLEVMPSVFSRVSTIRYSIPVSGRVSLKVTDLAGRVVATLQEGNLPAGRHEATWNGADAEGRQLANGVYFYRLEAPGLQALGKTVLTGR